MTGGADVREQLDAAQRRILERLVGEDVASKDEPGVAEAYADFRASMDKLRREFEELRA